MLEGMAEAQLADARMAGTAALYNFDLLKQSFEDKSKVSGGELEEAENGMASSKAANGVAKGYLDVTSKDLAEDISVLAYTRCMCMGTAEDFESATLCRASPRRVRGIS